MKKEDLVYLYNILIHIGIGLIGFVIPFSTKIYGFAILLYGIYYVVKNQNKNHEALIAAAYIVGSEVFLRMTGGVILYEISKYAVMLFIVMGAVYSGFSRNAVPYWLFLILLVPGIILAISNLNFTTNIRKAIAFNISGPVCLGVCSVYTFRRRLSIDQVNKILLSIALPIVSLLTYLVFYTPNVRDVITGTQSNFETSGGYGPNQVATVLGLGMFIFLTRMILQSQSKIQMIINLILTLNLAYRGMVTFSRGGMYTGFFMIVLFLLFLYFKSNSGGKVKLNYIIIFLSLAAFGTWSYTSFQTSGLIEKRYANQDGAGRVKQSKFTGREEIMEKELDIFFKNPILGVGVGKSAEVRQERDGAFAATHNELTRMLAEHGSLGVLALLVLFGSPFLLYFENNFNVFLLCFVAFWFLTINHASMRIAAPAFVYALALTRVQLGAVKEQQN